jgi:uncharacterized protein YacL (UPF0231 family)
MKRTRQETIADRKLVARSLQRSAHELEEVIGNVQDARNQDVVAGKEKALVLIAEELCLRAAQVARRVANNMEQLS